MPPALAPGTPAGSYRLSDIDTINLFNGNVNIYLPLTGVSGRGGAKSSVGLTWNSPARWQVVKSYDAYGNAIYGPQPDYTAVLSGSLRFGNWSAYFKRSVEVVTPCLPHDPDMQVAQYTLARLHVVEPDGTDHELRDTATGGQPLTNGGCYSPQGPSRGREFISTDGSGITMLFDDVVRDGIYVDQEEVTGGGGGALLLLPDGRRFRITTDSLTMRDRNGNIMSWDNYYGDQSSLGLAFIPGNNSSVKDSLNRRVAPGNAPVSECVALGGDPQGICSYVTYKGFGGVERRTYIGTNGAYLASHVFLPDGLSYRFYYNQYDDLIRIDLPTGGSIEYEYGPGLDGPQPAPDYRISNPLPGIYAGGPNDFHIYRRVTERRLYKEGHVLVNKQTFSKPEHTQNGNAGFVEKKLYDSDGTTLLSSEKHYFYGSANETFNVYDPFAYTPWKVGREYRTEFYSAGGNLLRAVEQSWQQRAPVPWWTGNPDEAPSNDPRIYQVTTTLENGLVSMTTYGYDPSVPYNSQTDVQEYDYGVGGPGPLLRRTHTDFVTDPGYTSTLTGAYIRDLPWQQWVSTDIWGQNRVSHTNFGYDGFTLVNAPNITGHDPAYTTAKTVRGNLTSVTRYADALGLTGAVTTTTHYDIAGNVVSATDALGNNTQLSYADSFCNDGGARCAGTFTPYTYAYPTGKTSPIPDASASVGHPAGTFGSTSALTASTVYDFYTGLVYSTTDANGQTTKIEYGDPLDRPTAQVRPGPTGGRTDISYAADGRSVHVSSDLDGSRRLESYQYFDGLGRAVRTQRYENSDASKPWLTVDTEYDAFGSVKSTSSPYRWTAGTSYPFSTNKWVEYTYDALNRVLTATTQPYGATVRTDYSGNRVLVKDPAGTERLSRADALGRPTEVWEITPEESGAEASTVSIPAFPGHPEAGHGYLTKYRYDALGNLRMVEQEGKHLGQTVTQRRFFAYDSLGRLVRIKHPEQGNMTADADFPGLTDSTSGVPNSQWSAGYSYDANGNVIKRKDARTSTLGVTTTYAYDHLDRNIVTTYTTPTGSGAATTPEVRRYYDGAPNGRGRLRRSEAVGVSASEVGAYDAMGRPTQHRQSFWGNGGWGPDYVVHLAYNKAGGVTSQMYPSGRTVTYSYDAAGRPGDYNGQAAFAGNLGDDVQRTYASEVRYHELGGMEQERFGTQTPVYNKSLYNSRGQLAEIRVSTHSILSPGQETNWNRGAIINHYSAGGWGASGGGSDNNGNLLKQELYIPHDDQISGHTNIVQEYGYDPLNRLNAVYDKPWNGSVDFYQLYKYDRWGNRAIAPNSWNAPAPQFSVDAATNRLGVPSGQAGQMNYDAAGNLVNDSYTGYGSGTGQQTRFYDAEGRMTSAQVSASQSANYVYDADGRRVKRNAGTAWEVWQVYGFGGELLAEYSPNAPASQPQVEYGFRGGELLVTAARKRVNFALSSNGGAATAQNYTQDGVFAGLHFQPTYANDGRRYASPQGDQYWRNEHGLPTWLLVDFGAQKSVDEVDIYTLPDYPAYTTQADPTATQTFTQYGVTSFDVQYWTGSVWAAVPGGSATGNNKVWRKLTFPALTTSKIRVRVNAAADGVARVVEVEAWGEAAGGAADIRWLVNDQLGTPRMVIDQTGSLAGVRRHDYLPFGEEVPGDLSWRTSARGYAGDPIRQKFTSKERDEETRLDYFLARYYSYQQGRFTSVDTFGPWAMSDGEKASFMSEPQQWNRYSYVTNNPLRYTDPDGLLRFDETVSEEQQKIILQALSNIARNGTDNEKAIANFLLTNDVTVSIARIGPKGKADFTGDDKGYGPTQKAIDSGPLTMSQAAGLVSIKILANEVKTGVIDSVKLEGLLVHEGKHAQDLARVAQGLSDPTGPNAGFDPTQFSFERAAFIAQAGYFKNSGNVGQQLGRHLGILELIPREGNQLPGLGVNEVGIRKILISDSYGYRVTVHRPGDTRTKATGLRPRQQR